MNCEVVAVGTELLLGQIVDTNSSWLGEQLAEAGIDSFFQTKVGDNHDRMVAVLRQALDRSDAVIVTGGLGPTQDDITRDAIAAVLGVDLERDPEVEERIRAMFGSRGRDMPANNLRQADVPTGARVMDQQPGTAPGLVCPVGGGPGGGNPDGEQVIYAVPGVPYEMREMVTGTVIPDLQRRAGVTSVIASRTLRTWGQSESGLAELLADHIDALDESGRATVAFLASGIEGLKVRVTVKSADVETAEGRLAEEEAVLRDRLGDLVFGVDDETMESTVVGLLATRDLTVAVAESVTGGLVAARLTAVPGASEVVRGGVVSYASETKFDVLDVPRGPVVTEATAAAMADGVRRLLGADVGLGVTGVAGPAELEGKPVGTVCLGLAIDAQPDTATIRLPGDRARIRDFATISLLDLLRRRLTV